MDEQWSRLAKQTANSKNMHMVNLSARIIKIKGPLLSVGLPLPPFLGLSPFPGPPPAVSRISFRAVTDRGYLFVWTFLLTAQPYS